MKLLVIGLGRINVKNKDGGAIRLYHVLRHFKGKGIGLDVLIPKRDVQNFRDYGVEANFHELSDPQWMGDNIPLIYVWRIIRGIAFVLSYQKQTDIVYSASDFWHDFLPALAYKLKHPRTKFVTCLFLIAPPPWKRYESIYTDRLSLPDAWFTLFFVMQNITIWLGRFFCNAFLVLNNQDRTMLIRRGVPEKNIYVVSMGVDIPRVVSSKDNKKFHGVYLGRIHPQKGITDLLSIWRIVVQTLPQAKLAIIGGGSSKEIRTLKTRIQQLDLSNNIVYLGYVDGRKKDRILRQSIVMLIPSHYESWGQVIAEGIASGLTVVAYALPAFRQIFGNVVIQVRLFSIDDFADVVLNNLKKPPLTDRVLKVRLHQIRSYAWHAIAARDYILMKSLRVEYEQKN